MRFSDKKLALIPPNGYRLVVADPPWQFEAYGERGMMKFPAYATMSVEEIASMWTDPLVGLGAAMQRHSVCALWVTAPMLDVGLDVMKAWGYAYKTRFVWIKTTPSGKIRMGYGHVARTCAELVLIGYRGAPKKPRMAMSDVFHAVNRGHSQKPERFQTMLEMMWPNATPRLELFGRRRREGWDVLGQEVGALPDFNKGD